MDKTLPKKSTVDFFGFLAEVIHETLNIRKNRHASWNVILRQILFTGYEALPLISFIALAIGGLIIWQGYTLLSTFVQSIWVHVILVMVVVNELSGLITALVVIARSGTAISTELGNMVVRREIALLKSFTISPISYLVVSRLVGVTLSLVVLSLYFNLVAILGGWLVSSLISPIDFRSFINEFTGVLKFSNILVSLIKPFVFGIIITLTACFQGMSVHHASTEVPQRTIKTVVNSITLIILSDVFITWLFWVLV